MATAIKVAVRVRPFNSREKEAKAACAVSMSGKQTSVFQSPSAEKKTFTFDYSYWSHDKPESPTYATNASIFNDLGKEIVQACFDGFNATVFAYGQTGSGKSFTMMGIPAEPGLIPLCCREIFERASNSEAECQVSCSYLEIYNEKVRDLLKPENSDKLVVREDPVKGPFVQGLSNFTVGSFEDIEKLVTIGDKQRIVAATAMNATSSRSHSILKITLVQIKGVSNIVSEVNLVDLAGSERQSKTNATGDRLKEAQAINLSLSALGQVISALAKKAANPKQNIHIPYRDSILTRLLQNSLGGNAKTYMLAAISPATTEYDETVSTLRYADNVKMIKNQAAVNETSSEARLAAALKQIEDLKAQLKKAEEGGGGAPDTKMVEELTALLQDREEEMARLNKSQEERLAEMRAFQAEREAALADSGLSLAEISSAFTVDPTTPHLVNIAPDASLSGSLVYFLRKDRTVVGSSAEPGDDKADIVLDAPGVAKQHCVLEKSDAGVTLTPATADEKAPLFVNGKAVDAAGVELKFGDRIIIGHSAYFRFVDPRNKPAETSSLQAIDFETAQAELLDAKGELEKFKQMLAEEQSRRGAESKERAADSAAFMAKATALMNVVNRVNLQASEIGRPVTFSVRMKRYFSGTKNALHTMLLVEAVHAVELPAPVTVTVPDHVFLGQVPAYESFYASVKQLGLAKVKEMRLEDPFQPTRLSKLVGVANATLSSPFNMSKMTVPVTAEGKQVGELEVSWRVQVAPQPPVSASTSAESKSETDDDEQTAVDDIDDDVVTEKAVYSDPDEKAGEAGLLDKLGKIVIHIESARLDSAEKGLHLSYALIDRKIVNCISKSAGSDSDAHIISHTQAFYVDNITTEFLHALSTVGAQIDVYADAVTDGAALPESLLDRLMREQIMLEHASAEANRRADDLAAKLRAVVERAKSRRENRGGSKPGKPRTESKEPPADEKENAAHLAELARLEKETRKKLYEAEKEKAEAFARLEALQAENARLQRDLSRKASSACVIL